MKTNMLRAKKSDGWNQLRIHADEGKRLWIDPDIRFDKGVTTLTIIEGPPKKGSDDVTPKNNHSH